jgi:hypothetical protein
MDHGKGAGTTEPASVGPAGDAGPIKPGGTKTPLRPYARIPFREGNEDIATRFDADVSPEGFYVCRFCEL